MEVLLQALKEVLKTTGLTNEKIAIINSSNTLWRCQFIPFNIPSEEQTTNK
jgi:hypothetical protein